MTPEGGLRVVAPTEFHRRWVEDRYRAQLDAAVAEILGSAIPVEIVVEDPGNGEVSAASLPSPGEPPPPALTPPRRPSDLVGKYTFENFVVGPSNRFTHAAALAVAEQPGGNYNPLFIYADAGLGKTHLLHAVGHYRLELEPAAIVRYVSSERFFNEFINGIRRKRMDEFKTRYRSTDVLLLDDVQFFEGKEQILEEFFHTFNTLYEAGKQLVISSDRHPKHLATLEDRLRSRFEWGLLTDIQPPDIETRLAILRKNAEFAPTPVPPEVLGFIAEHVHDNVRELEGALTRVTAYAALTHEEITLEMAREVLRDVVHAAGTAPLTVDRVIDAVCRHYEIGRAELLGPSRRQPLARHRQVAMYLTRELTDLSLPKIGAAFGGRDHSTVIHAVDRVRRLLQEDGTVFHDVTRLTEDLRRIR